MLVPNWTLMECRLVPGGLGAEAATRHLATRGLSACGPNDPELVLASLRHLGGDLALVQDSDGLRLSMPVVRRSLPLPLLGNRASPISTFGPPHLDADLAVPALTAFLRHVGAPVLIQSVPRDGAAWEALTAAGQVAEVERWHRAGLQVSGSFDAWFERNFERKRRKEYRRLKARLAEAGHLVARSLAPGEDPLPWISRFLDVEAASWKGGRGTALKSDAKATAALRDACTALARHGRLRFWILELDGRPIAALYATVDRGQAWLGKIAFDPAFAKFSPGVLVVLHATERIFAEGGIALVDSCAIPGHPMIDNIWRDRIAMADVVVAHPGFSRAAFAATAMAERARRLGHAALRGLRNRMTGRHRS
ncbi:MAG: GNAT family N-acetyltransferase [Aestuariivirga sp.]|jgi:hypothetical protein